MAVGGRKIHGDGTISIDLTYGSVMRALEDGLVPEEPEQVIDPMIENFFEMPESIQKRFDAWMTENGRPDEKRRLENIKANPSKRKS